MSPVTVNSQTKSLSLNMSLKCLESEDNHYLRLGVGVETIIVAESVLGQNVEPALGHTCRDTVGPICRSRAGPELDQRCASTGPELDQSWSNSLPTP